MNDINHHCDYCNSPPQSFLHETGRAFVWYCGTGEDIQKGIIRSSLCLEREAHNKTKEQNQKLRELLEMALTEWGLVRGKAYEEIRNELNQINK